MKLIAALWAAVVSATLGESFLGPPLPGQNIDASLQDSASAVEMAGSGPGLLNMLAPGGNTQSGTMSLSQAVSTFRHRADIIDDVYDASGTSWLQNSKAAVQGAGASNPSSPFGRESTMANMATPWLAPQQQQQQQQLPILQPLSMQQQLLQQQPQVQLPQAQPIQQTQQFLQSQPLGSFEQQSQPLGSFQQMKQLPTFATMQQPAPSFIMEPLAAEMRPAPVLNADQLFRDSSPPQQSSVMESAVSPSQVQPQLAGPSLLSLLGQGQGQGFGPTDPPRESPWIAMSDPTREPPMQQQYGQTNPDLMSFGQFQQSNMMGGQFQQSNMMGGQFQQSNMMGGQFQQSNVNLQFQQSAVPSRGQFQQSNMMGGNPNMMAFEQQSQQAFPGNNGCILCNSQAAQEAPSQNKWADYFSKGADDKRRHEEAFE